jgi:hypothetical protein
MINEDNNIYKTIQKMHLENMHTPLGVCLSIFVLLGVSIEGFMHLYSTEFIR